MIYGQGVELRKNKQFLYIAAIILIFLFITGVIVLFGSNGVWGSETDWVNQHFAIPEYFRTRFYRTGDLFPDFAPQLGGGQNIYNFAYYGLMNPLYLPAYLMPYVSMAEYIQAVSLLSVLISCIMCYCLMCRHFTYRVSFLLAIMFMCSAPLIFHSHRHIMFVSYFPFLFAALFAVGGEDSVKNRGVLIVSSYCILCSSFYFSISAFSVILIYSVYVRLKNFEGFTVKQLIRRISWKIGCIVLGCMIAGILWLPTFLTLLSGREKGSSFVNVLKLLIPTINLQYLLYSSYSMGLTSISIISIIVMLKYGDRSTKLLAIVFTALLCCPLIIYLCNGTMYIDSKILIPFLPLMLIVCGEFFLKLFAVRIKLPVIALIFSSVIAIDMLFNYRELMLNLLIAADSITVMIVLIIFVKNRRKKALLIPTVVFAIINCIVVNLSENFVSKDDMNSIYSEDILELADKTFASDTEFYRFANDADIGATVNRIYGENYYTATVYSSVSNSDYRDFRFGISASENSCRNNAIQTQPHNEIFNIFMGCRYRISKDSEAMLGEKMEDHSGEYYLFSNNNAFPMGYASANTISEECYNNLNYAEKSEAILENIVVPQTSTLPVIPTKTEKLEGGYTIVGDTSSISEINGAYEIKSDFPFTVSAELDQPICGKLILIRFFADNRIGNKSERDDISVAINGVKNKLSAPDWKYNNKNYEFSYVLSSDEPVEKLVFEFSKGDYIVSGFEIYTLDGSVLTESASNKDEFVIDRETMGGDTIEGNIKVTADGWFNLSVPYDKGFEILVDGVKTEYYKTNTAFIGFPITKGEHYIKINYQAPYRLLGMIITISGCIMSICSLAYAHSLQRRRSVCRSRIIASPNGAALHKKEGTIL